MKHSKSLEYALKVWYAIEQETQLMKLRTRVEEREEDEQEVGDYVMRWGEGSDFQQIP